MDFDFKRLQKLVEAINTYYAFALFMYVVVLYVASHSQLFLWVLLGITPLLALWTGYILKSFLDSRSQKHGFNLLSNVMNYEVLGDGRYLLHFHTKLRAASNRMMAYPIGYQWSGARDGEFPRLADPEQKIIGVVQQYDSAQDSAKVSSYKETVSSEGDWNYWFVGFNHALYKGEVVDIKYSQNFYDKKKIAKPCIYYLVNTSMKRLELNVKFPAGALPTKVTSSYSKLSDRRQSHPVKGVVFDADKQWATWIISNPKKGHCYRIDWR